MIKFINTRTKYLSSVSSGVSGECMLAAFVPAAAKLRLVAAAVRSVKEDKTNPMIKEVRLQDIVK